MDCFCLQGLISCELFITARVWGAKQAEGAGVGVALMLGLSALGGFPGVQNSRMELLTRIQRKFPGGAEKISLYERQGALIVQYIFASVEGS